MQDGVAPRELGREVGVAAQRQRRDLVAAGLGRAFVSRLPMRPLAPVIVIRMP